MITVTFKTATSKIINYYRLDEFETAMQFVEDWMVKNDGKISITIKTDEE